jgi:hypothetical protein
MNIAGFAAALTGCNITKRPRTSPALPEPLTFVVHRTNGRLWPALYHGEWKIGCYDEIAREWPLDTLPNAAELCAMPPGDLMRELWSRYQALETLGALPERAGPPTPRSAR